MLFIRNDPTAPEALLGDVFTESGFEVTTFDVIAPQKPDDPKVEVSFPDPSGFDVVVPLGSRWGVNDEGLGWVADEMAMVRSALAVGVGVLGVCFGGQLLAAALGGSVQRAPRPEIGWYDVHSDAPDLIPGGPWFQWHFDRFTPPPEATVLARTEQATQAFVLGRAMGLQFHPEVDPALVEQWIGSGELDALDIDTLDIDPDAVRQRTASLADDAARRLRLLVRGFLGRLDNEVGDGPRGLG